MSSQGENRPFRPALVAAPVVLAGVVGLGFLWELDRQGVERGFPLDDSWIHLRFASNLAAGRGFGCNPGEPTPGATSPLWVLVLAAAAKLSIPLETAAIWLGMLCNAGACAALMLLSKKVLTRSALLGQQSTRFWVVVGAGVFFALTPCAVWSSVSGLEIPLFMMLSFLALASHEDACARGGWRWPVSALLFGLAAHARPEGHLLFAFAALERVLRERREHEVPLLRRVCRVAAYGLIYLLAVSPYVFFCLATTGRPLPNTYYAKTVGERNVWSLHFLKLLVRLVAWDHFLLGLFVPIGLVAHLARRRGSLLPALWIVGLPLAYTLMPLNVFTMNAGNFSRYFYPVVPLAAMFGVHGLAVASVAMGRRLRHGRVAIAGVLCLGCGLNSLWHVLDRRDLFVMNVRNINEMQVVAGRWVRDHTPAQARLAVCDAGAIPYFSDRHVADTVGLVTPSLLPYIEAHAHHDEPYAETPLALFLERVRPDYLIVFPEWYPHITAELEKLGAKVKEFSIKENLTCGGDTMVVYKLSGPRDPRQR